MTGATKKPPAPDARRDLEKELAAAAALKHQLREAFGGETDTTLLRDMIEGETGLDGAIDGVLEQMAVDMAGVQGLERFESVLAARRKRLSDRIETLRTMLLNALDIVELKRATRPLATIVARPVAPKLHIVDEAAIPTMFFTQPEPVLSKSALTEMLKARRNRIEERLADLDSQLKAGAINADEYAEMRQSLFEANPPIPGAELDNGSATIAIHWS